MDDPLIMGRGQASADLHAIVDGLAHRDRSPPQASAERLTFEQLEDDVGQAILRADVVEGEDVGMVQRSDRPRLLLESPEAIGIARVVGGNELDGNIAAEAGISGAKDLSHPARPERGKKRVRAEATRRHEGLSLEPDADCAPTSDACLPQEPATVLPAADEAAPRDDTDAPNEGSPRRTGPEGTAHSCTRRLVRPE